MHPILTNAVKAARRAGSIITRASQDVGALKIRSKTYNDFVSEVDHAAERAIIETLIPITGSWARRVAIPTRMPRISGSSIRWMGPPTFCTISRNTASPSR
jgi:hypothetical protein